jgi:8-oxo-dGTP pyrophosphatase MutT (NUDIX family)
LSQNFEYDSLRRKLLTEGKALEPEDQGPPLAAVSIIIDPDRSGSSILLIRRTKREGDPWSGQIAFPGGHKTPKDRAFLDTAIREAREEVGINLREHEVLGVLPLAFTRSRSVRVVPFVFLLKKAVRVRLNREVARSFWVPLGELAEAKRKMSKVRVQEGKLTTNAYVYEGNVIWGLTFRIINLLLRI